MAAILHFLGKNVAWIALAGDMKNLESLAIYPLANLIFPEFVWQTPFVVRSFAQLTHN